MQLRPEMFVYVRKGGAAGERAGGRASPPKLSPSKGKCCFAYEVTLKLDLWVVQALVVLVVDVSELSLIA